MKLSDSNEGWKPKFANGGTHYDVAFPSEYIQFKIEKRSFIVTSIDHNKVPNIKNLDSDYMNMSFDRGTNILYLIS